MSLFGHYTPLPGIDIGGSLCKIAFFEPDEGSSSASLNVGDVNYNSRAEQTRRWVERDFIVGATKYGSTGTRDPLLSTRYRNQGMPYALLHEPFDVCKNLSN